MIPKQTIDEIQQLLMDGVERPEIMRVTGVSRSTVTRVARRIAGRDRKRQAIEPHLKIVRGAEIARCPGCGAKVAVPCVECQLLAIKRGRRALREIARENT